ncbi:MAG: peroxidase [Candidatus Cloacimonetes bacterium]|nr:peroxidase [Candidatus Cloacimonadota bacterium]MCF7813554.1 peroxidase [Candidatus Cloacimonadota bacterium]MCF7868185.1 peroxidase [Candidatus Cloacimonadota bacterium]MCF7883651.1 peroxidase [Candidatus Cloacimonadota bacterium]
MAWIKQLKKEELTEEHEKYLKEMKTSWDRMGNILKVQSIKPSSMKQHALFYKSLMFEKSCLTRSQREMIAVVVSKVNLCEY